MPELPEVETTVRELKKTLINLGVVDVWSDWEKSIKSQSLKIFKQNIVGEKILNISRRAKIIIFELSGEKILLAHQKMTGHFLIGKWKYNPRAKRKWQSVEVGPLHDRVNDYIHIMFWLSNDRQLAFSDLRKFGWIKLIKNKKVSEIEEFKKLGPEPLSKSFTPKILKSQLSKTSRSIKQAIMDPKVIAGIGNIYADETLFLSKIHPLVPAHKLSFQKIKELHEAIQSTLKIAIKNKGTTILSGAEEYRLPMGERGKYQEMRKVYRREGEPCPVCGTKIKRIKIGQRSAHFCSACQKLD
ncbi:DNA-formamidopyrimidine glycosylase [bacterium]|nr:MAG: DNA-formamidopyrimidine glycosylase [bacterium]